MQLEIHIRTVEGKIKSVPIRYVTNTSSHSDVMQMQMVPSNANLKQIYGPENDEYLKVPLHFCSQSLQSTI